MSSSAADWRPRVAVLIGDAAVRSRVEAALQTGADLVDARVGGMPGVDVVVTSGPLRTFPLGEAAMLVITDGAADAHVSALISEGRADRVVTGFAAEDLAARTMRLARTKRARDVLRAAVPDAPGDLDALACAAAARARQADEAVHAVEEARQARDQFLAILAHELRTPLNAVLGWTTLLRRDGRSDKDVQRGLEVIDRNARAQARLIEELLDIAAAAQRKIELKQDVVALGTVVSQAIDAARPAAEEQGIEIRRLSDEGDLAVVGDPERLVQVVHNLLGNALKFTPSGGRVTVGVRRSGPWVELEVSDTGVGIAPDLLPRVFEPFIQGARPSQHGPGGLGLGLAIARHLVGLHGGTLEASSPGAGKGATFTARLPVHAPAAPAEPA